MNSDAVFYLVVFLCIVLFTGDPDLHDKLLRAVPACEVTP